MLTRTFNDLPFEYLAPGKFEELCLALVRRDVDSSAQHLGAAGSDEGYDVRATVAGKVVCYQCKRYRTFQLSHAKTIIEEAFRGKQPPDEMVFVLPRPVRVELRRQIESACPVPCSFWARTELQDRIWCHAELIERFFGRIRSRTSAPHWTIPRRNPYFTGRADTIQSLREALLADGLATLGQIRAVVGLGGVGKTQTAIEYANAFHLNYSAAFWIAAETESTLRASLMEMARVFELPEADEAKEDVAIRAVLNRLASGEGWLLIYDNVEDLELLNRFQPPKLTGHVLVTSRLQSLAQYQYRLLELSSLDGGEAVEFLLDRTGRELDETSPDYQSAVDLVETLGRLPLALEQAAAYILSLGTSFSKYLEAYRSRGVALLDSAQVGGYLKSVTSTWALNFQRVESENPLSAHLFKILAVLAPDDVPEFLFRRGDGLGSKLAYELASSPLALDGLLEPLRRLSLVRRDVERESITTHRLVQDIARFMLDSEDRNSIIEEALTNLMHHFPDPELMESWPRCERLLSQVASIDKHGEEALAKNLTALRLFTRAGDYCYVRGLYVRAEMLFSRALRIAEAALGKDHPNFAMRLCDLATAYQAQKRDREAEKLYCRVIETADKTLGHAHPKLAHSLNNLGCIYRDQGRLEDAEPVFQRALQIYAEIYEDEHPDVATALVNLGLLFRRQGRFEEAESLYLRSISIFEKSLERNYPNTAATFNDLANLYRDQGRFEEAVYFSSKSYRICCDVLGVGHPHAAVALTSHMKILNQLNRHDEADQLRADFDKALAQAKAAEKS